MMTREVIIFFQAKTGMVLAFSCDLTGFPVFRGQLVRRRRRTTRPISWSQCPTRISSFNLPPPPNKVDVAVS